MNIKYILRPDKKKISLFVIIAIMVVLSIFVRNIFVPEPPGPPSISYGYPFPFFSAGGLIEPYWVAILNPFLWIDIVIAYILACKIVFVYSKWKGRKGK